MALTILLFVHYAMVLRIISRISMIQDQEQLLIWKIWWTPGYKLLN